MGCMSGLIHMFDFRRSPKLISDGTIRRSSGEEFKWNAMSSEQKE